MIGYIYKSYCIDVVMMIKSFVSSIFEVGFGGASGGPVLAVPRGVPPSRPGSDYDVLI